MTRTWWGLSILVFLLATGCQSIAERPVAADTAASDISLLRGTAVPSPGAELGALEPLSSTSPLKHPETADLHFRSRLSSLGDTGSTQSFSPRALRAKEMAVHAINVGQGDAFLLEFACGAVLIDAGLQPGQIYRDQLVAYMDWFFARRPDLSNTLELVAISHDHADHRDGLSSLFGHDAPISITVKNAIDNGYDVPDSAPKRDLHRAWADSYQPIWVKDIKWYDGATSKVIDPIGACGADVDPVISVLWGGFPAEASEFKNPNHQSVVMRVDYGQSSFLFTGDLQTRDRSIEGGGLNKMLDEYASDLRAFDVDALKVSHHGADNGTTRRLLDAVTPCFAFMGVGPHTEGGRGAGGHGHPRRVAIDLLDDAVSAAGNTKMIWAFADGTQAPARTQIDKAIFGTAWDGEYVIYATHTGRYSVETEQGETLSIRCR